MGVMEKISAYWKQFSGEVTGDQAKYDEGRRQAAASDAPSFEERGENGVPGAVPRVLAGSEGAVTPAMETPPPVADYSDVEQLKLFRLVPVAAANDTNWDNAPNQGEVVVRARSSGDARVVAAEAELDFMEIDALPADGNSTTSSSAFRNEKLYTVIDETDPSYPVEGPREVVAGTVRVDNIRPSEF